MLDKVSLPTALIILGTIAAVVVCEVMKVPVPSSIVALLGTVVAGAAPALFGKGPS